MKTLISAAARGEQNLRQLYYNLLNAHTVGGIFCLLFLFVLCFVCVHILKCAKIGFLQSRKTPDDPPAPTPPPKKEDKKDPAPQQPEPIYYIVERKRMRRKNKYRDNRKRTN